MGALIGYDDEGILTINSVVLNGPAWAAGADENGNNGLLQLWMSADKRGEDRVSSNTHGVIAYKRLRTGTRFDVNFTITGDVNRLGVVNSNSATGLAVNLKYIRDNVIDPGDAQDDGTVPAALSMWGQSFSGDVHVLGLKPTGPYPARDKEAIFNGVLQLSIPAGRLA